MLSKVHSRVHWFKYYYIDRKLERFIPWVARKLPKRIKYFVVIHGIAVVTGKPNCELPPDAVPAWNLLKEWE